MLRLNHFRSRVPEGLTILGKIIEHNGGKAMKSFGKIIDLIIVFIAITFIPRLSILLANSLNPLIQRFDKDGVFLWISIVGIFQLILTIVIMRIYFKSRLRDWGFNLDNSNKAIKIVGRFIIVFSVIEISIWMIFLNNISSIKQFIGYPLPFKNIFGYYGFETFLSGTCEEPLFRGFAILVLAQSWKGTFKIGKIDFTTAGILSAILFTYAHISFSIFPFKITYLNPMQLFLVFFLGLFCAIVFQKTKSLLIPILLHNLSNIIAITIPFILLLINNAM